MRSTHDRNRPTGIFGFWSGFFFFFRLSAGEVVNAHLAGPGVFVMYVSTGDKMPNVVLNFRDDGDEGIQLRATISDVHVNCTEKFERRTDILNRTTTVWNERVRVT